MLSFTGATNILKKDSMPAHYASQTIELRVLLRETPKFVGPDVWTPKSFDLNPASYYTERDAGACVSDTKLLRRR